MLKKLLIVSLAVSTLAFAQGKKGGGGSGGGGGMMQPSATSRIDFIASTLKLDKDAKKQVKALMDDAQKEALPIKEQMEKDRIAVAEAQAGGKKDDIDAAVKTYAQAETQMASIEMHAFAKIYKLLDRDQQQKVPPVYAMMPGIFKAKNWNDAPTGR